MSIDTLPRTQTHESDDAENSLDKPVEIGEGQDSLFELDDINSPESTFQVPEYHSPLAQRIKERAERAQGRVESLTASIEDRDQISISSVETNEERAERGIAAIKAFGSAALRKAKEIGIASIGVGVLVAERTRETTGALKDQANRTTRAKLIEIGTKASERLEARAKQKAVDAAHEEAQPYNDYLNDHAEAIEMNKVFDSPEQRAIREVRRENAEFAARRRQERRDARIQRATAVPRAAARLAGRAYRSRTSRTLRAAGRAIRNEWNRP